MARLNAREVAEKQIRKSQAAGEDYVKGINAVTVAPTQLAKKKKDKLKNNFLKAIDSGKWEDGLDAVSLEDWKKAAESKGGTRYGQGVQEAEQKIIAFHEEFLPFVQSVQDKVNAMSDATPEQRIQKMVANAQELAKFRRTRRRRS